MIRSMTAFARCDHATDSGSLSWELKTVNHRFNEVSMRLPEEFRPLEPVLRERARRAVARGKLEANLRFNSDPAVAGSRLALNEPLARALSACHADLARAFDDCRRPDPAALMQWPGLIIEQRPDFEPLHAAALTAFDQALTLLIETRAREGAAIAAMIAARLDGIEQQVQQVREHLPAVRRALRRRFEERLAGIGPELEPGRLEQEVVLQLAKLDVDEELDRLDTHVAEARRVLELDEPVGRRLDFLMQEFNREANTLASKAASREVTGASIELKVLIEQMREQIQNVE